jgi:hypothetical protein
LRGREIALVESVRQDRRRGLTIFDEQFVVGAGARRQTHDFTLTFRTLPMNVLIDRIERAGLRVRATCGDYEGGKWTTSSATWIIEAERR